MALFFIPKAAPVSGGENYAQCKLYFYATGTSTAALVYTDSALSTAHPQPVVADAGGVFAPIYVDPSVSYRVVLRSSGGSLIWDVDPFSASFDDAESIGGILWPRSATEIAAGVTPSSYAYEVGDIRRYGGVGNGSTSNASTNAAAIINAIAVAEVSGGEVYIPTGVFCFSSSLVINSQGESVTLRGESAEGSVLRKSFSGTGIEIDDYARPRLENFTLDKTGTDTGVGILITQAANSTSLRNLVVTGHGSHGIEVIEANLLTLQDLTLLSNGGDGLKLNGAATPDVNAGTFVNIDARGNTGWGINFDDAWANFGVGLVAQSNTAGGIRLNNARQNSLQLYAESNTSTQITLVDSAECKGNHLIVAEGAVTFGGTTAARNTVLHMKRGATFDPNFNKVTSDKFVLPNELQDATNVSGVLTVSHTVNGRYDFVASDYDAEQSTVFSHSNASYAHRLDTDKVLLKKAATNCSTGQVMLGSTTQATVGAAGGASNVPAAPTGYLIINVAGTPAVIPYFAAS